MKAIISLLAIAVMVMGCAGLTGVVKTGADTYMVANHGTMGWSSGPAQMAKAMQKANDYCAALGKQVQVSSSNETPSGFGKIASAEVHFQCVTN